MQQSKASRNTSPHDGAVQVRRVPIGSDAPSRKAPVSRPAPASRPVETRAPQVQLHGLVGITSVPVVRRRPQQEQSDPSELVVWRENPTELVAPVAARDEQALATAPPGAPPQRPAMSPGLWRWMPVIVLAVLVLMVAAQGVSHLRTQESIDSLRSELATTAHDKKPDADLLDAVGRQVRDGADSQRVTTLQDISTLLASERDDQRQQIDRLVAAQQDAQRKADEQLRAALAQQQTEMKAELERIAAQRAADQEAELAAKRIAAASAAPATTTTTPTTTTTSAPPASVSSVTARLAAQLIPPAVTPAAATTAAQPNATAQAVFFIDASGRLIDQMPQVSEEVSRELNALDARRRVRILLLTPDQRLLEIPSAAVLDRLAHQMSGFTDVATRLRGGAIDQGVVPLSDALVRAAADHPEQLFILSDTLGAGSDADKLAIRQAVADQTRDAATRVHTLHFFASDGRDVMRAIARENRGTYSFVPQR